MAASENVAEAERLLREVGLAFVRVTAMPSGREHDLFRVAKAFVSENGGQFVAEDLVPTDATDFSPYLLKIRQARPDVVASNRSSTRAVPELSRDWRRTSNSVPTGTSVALRRSSTTGRRGGGATAGATAGAASPRACLRS